LILLAIVLIFGAYIILRSLKKFIINAIAGLFILFLANRFISPDIGYSWLVILVCGIGGAVGAVLLLALCFIGFGI